MKKALVHIAALAALAFALPAAAAAQIQEVDPDSGQAWQQPQPAPTEAPPPTDWTPAEQDPQPPMQSEAWTPIEPPADATDPALAPPVVTGQQPASPTEANRTVPREDIFEAAQNVFGEGAEGLAGILEDILRDQGEPVAYIAGEEAGGAFILGVRYGSGVMRHRTAGDRVVYWTGPSIGFDVGADASKVFVLVYNLSDAEQLFRRYPSGEGRAYFVGGFSANYLRRGDVVLIPVRLGVGLRLGVNAGYMRFSSRNRWLPF
jgi:hypothetical protein